MSDFGTSKTLKVRKDHACMQCHRSIPKGSQAVRGKGQWEGEFYCHHVHVECETAADAYAKLHGLMYAEEYPWFGDGDFEFEDWRWMVINHLTVARRLFWDDKVREWLEDSDEDCLDSDDKLALAALAATPARPDREVSP